MKKRIEDRLILSQSCPVAMIDAYKTEPDSEMRGFILGCFCTRMIQLTESNPGQTKRILDELDVPKKLRSAAEGALMTMRIS